MKKAIQFFLFFLMVLIAIVFYYNYLKIDKKDDNIEKSNNQSLINEQSNLIKNLKYEVKFDDNSQYFIQSDLSEIKYIDDIETVYMSKVTAIITNKDNVQLLITSNKSTYNNLNYNTLFEDNVRIKYLDNVINSDKLDLIFTDNIIKIYENVVYEGIQGTVKTDNVEINLITKKIDFFMNNQDKKVTIKSK